MNRPLLVLTSLIAFASPCRAASFVWFFSSANPTCDAVPANPVNLCNSDYNAPTATFADTTATFDITARGYDLGTGTSPLTLIVGTTVWTVPSMSPNNDLWAKFDGGNLGADETGLGVANPNTGGNREIEKTNFIQLDLTSLPAVQSVDLVISSLQSTETATVWGSNTLGQPGLLLATFVGPGAGGAAVVTFHYDLSAGPYLTVSANPNVSGSNNILIQSGFAAEIPAGGDLLYECAKRPPNFVISDGVEDDLTAVKGVLASFSVAGLTVSNLKIGNATFAPFTIGHSNSNVRFTTSMGGQCVGVSNFKGFVNPGPFVVKGRALTLLKSNPFFCREPTRDIICFQVTGQVRAPFPTNLACTPDRVEYACGLVS